MTVCGAGCASPSASAAAGHNPIRPPAIPAGPGNAFPPRAPLRRVRRNQFESGTEFAAMTPRTSEERSRRNRASPVIKTGNPSALPCSAAPLPKSGPDSGTMTKCRRYRRLLSRS